MQSIRAAASSAITSVPPIAAAEEERPEGRWMALADCTSEAQCVAVKPHPLHSRTVGEICDRACNAGLRTVSSSLFFSLAACTPTIHEP